MRFLPHIIMAVSIPAAMASVTFGVEAVFPMLLAFSVAAAIAQVLVWRARRA